MENCVVFFVFGFYKIFDEIFVNVVDNSQCDVFMIFFKVIIDSEMGEILVENNGKGILVEMYQKEGCYIFEFIFGYFFIGLNYDDDEKKMVGGCNGYGVKFINIFSLKFILECQDSVNGK